METEKESIKLPNLMENKEFCCGCAACYAICPVSAIKMCPDEEGFLYPKINASLCIHCSQCINVCIFKSNYKPTRNTGVYAARLKDTDGLMKSSSGGAFTALSDHFLHAKGAIVCSIYNQQTIQPEFKLIYSRQIRDLARGSIYVQSNPGTIFSECENYLKENPDKQLLYIGMGCQAAAFKQYISQKRLDGQVTVVDIICHGVSSPKMWKDYIQLMEDRHHGKIAEIHFKDKRNGWKKPYAFFKINDQEYPMRDYIRIYFNHCALRPSCYHCPYTSVKRMVDLTIGDYWGIEYALPDFYSETGTSLLLVHSDKGQALFDAVCDTMQWVESQEDNCIQNHLLRPTECSEHRKEFWRDYQQKGIQFILKKYGTVPVYKKIINKCVSLVKKKKSRMP